MTDFIDVYGASEVIVHKADGTVEVRPPYDVHELQAIVHHRNPSEREQRREAALRGSYAGGAATREKRQRS